MVRLRKGLGVFATELVQRVNFWRVSFDSPNFQFVFVGTKLIWKAIWFAITNNSTKKLDFLKPQPINPWEYRVLKNNWNSLIRASNQRFEAIHSKICFPSPTQTNPQRYGKIKIKSETNRNQLSSNVFLIYSDYS